jgi:hypothetical protein
MWDLSSQREFLIAEILKISGDCYSFKRFAIVIIIIKIIILIIIKI